MIKGECEHGNRSHQCIYCEADELNREVDELKNTITELEEYIKLVDEENYLLNLTHRDCRRIINKHQESLKSVDEQREDTAIAIRGELNKILRWSVRRRYIQAFNHACSNLGILKNHTTWK
ncbi:MAG: hypothetical protein Tp136SUR676911_40 [Prokaryotic dsDNA virus sp.]|jgi:regulator of replication initiation timing|nr:MAG: hypothetical protein Tp136SUR676911_40 [Prokaryotic dsDNA virus sp.]|tara:strand:- start:659 stop:1021 length:363 start_codon:yes stop_codon:yes gene_type:complete